MSIPSGWCMESLTRTRRVPGAGWSLAALVLVLATQVSGCSTTQIAADAFADAMGEGGGTYAADDDVEFVGNAIPFALKTTEGLLEEAPDHRGLLLAATRGFTQYAYVYIELPADEKEDSDVDAAYAERARAQRMYQRAMRYGLRGLSLAYPGFAEAVRLDPAAAMSDTVPEDVPFLYWTAAAWGAAIGLGADDPALLAELPVVEAMLRRALSLDETYQAGAIHVALIRVEIAQRGIREGAADRARGHYDRALVLSDGRQASPHVTFAEAVSVAEQNRVEFESMLGLALAIDVDEDPQWRLANLVMQRRARWLLDRTDYVFLD